MPALVNIVIGLWSRQHSYIFFVTQTYEKPIELMNDAERKEHIQYLAERKNGLHQVTDVLVCLMGGVFRF